MYHRKLSSKLTFVKLVETFKVLFYIRKVQKFVFPLVTLAWRAAINLSSFVRIEAIKNWEYSIFVHWPLICINRTREVGLKFLLDFENPQHSSVNLVLALKNLFHKIIGFESPTLLIKLIPSSWRLI